VQNPDEALYRIGEICKDVLDKDERRFGTKTLATEILSIVTEVPEATPKKAKKE
jgi:hypothetical protein